MKITGEITYQRKRQIGVGQGMNSVVFLADDPQLGGEIAVKEIQKSHLGNDPVKFFQESTTMNDVGHPNIVPIRCAFQTPNMICIAMDYYSNGSLADRTLLGPIPLNEINRIGQGVISGVGSIHSAGYLHFDIKPSNIFFDDHGHPLVADFGQARQIASSGVTLRPAMYIGGFPPECYRGIGFPQTDIYQVGLLLYRAANGDGFFNDQYPTLPDGDIDDVGLENLITSGKFPDRSKFMPHVPKGLRTVIRKALNIDPAHRFQTAIELSDALGKIAPTNNWVTALHSSGDIEWRSHRPSKPTILVKLVKSGQKWSVEIYNERPHKTTRRTTDHWQVNLTKLQAMDYLKSLFEGLE